MRYLFCLLFIPFFSCSVANKTFTASEIKLLPKPEEITLGEASFLVKNGKHISFENEDQKQTASYLVKLLEAKTGNQLSLVESGRADIQFKTDETLEDEAYTLLVTPDNITIKSNSRAGAFYAVQTLNQLLSEDNNVNQNQSKWLVPSIEINDAPRFKWRAYMLDEARYFHGEDFVKQMLDQMAALKMNVFHWHLVDDAGWRIEIKKYPLLTEVGAFRTDSEIGTWKSGKTSGEPHGGFYTQEQIKDIVAYAAERNIKIVPEFEMPGHSSAAIAAYTWLGTADIDIDVPVKFGRHYDNYDVTKPETIQFVKDVLLELFDLFPSDVIHIGGDEVPYEVWEKSPRVQKYMAEHGIKTPADLQIDFVNKISLFMQDHGRRMMGWNEIMGKKLHFDFEEKKDDEEAETELAKNVIVHFWKGDINLLTEAASKGYGIVNSWHKFTYLDYKYKGTPLEKAYRFNPIPDGLDEKYHKNVYGLGCQMWSEWTPTNKDVEFQTFPRIAAYAEVGWTTLENKDFESFKLALAEIKKGWDLLGINSYKIE
ncbi:beta-N-acetylhexosaminidase [Aestuariibaculum suncheonense]|uniref:beta-N-acetylhexosaminidase n=1 Tax=Aestuariibaculum suncheonense TaxID=1028745 RepID=A0A8J6Q2A5_9FLAO|nr:beta-N-acetylhexosaminidase [Aestuariibaculum suncheonense]MBD0834158.1 beta-N-acetylhexosaminidase [Aestuariibaculum suncheonense]